MPSVPAACALQATGVLPSYCCAPAGCTSAPSTLRNSSARGGAVFTAKCACTGGTAAAYLNLMLFSDVGPEVTNLDSICVRPVSLVCDGRSQYLSLICSAHLVTFLVPIALDEIGQVVFEKCSPLTVLDSATTIARSV